MSEKKKHRVMIGIEISLLCMIIATLSTNAASSNPPSNGVSYNKNNQVTVQNALDDLYTKANYGNATASQILKGRTALVGGKQITGTYVAPTLSSQTPGNVTEADILKDKIAWVNGNKIIGTGSKSNQKLSYILKVGDYVKYVPSKETYTISGEETGHGEQTGHTPMFDFNGCKNIFTDQIIHPSELTLWRVIKYNSDGTVEAISVNTSSDDVYFRALSGVSSSECKQDYLPIGYRNYVGVLNKIASSYETEGITIGSRHMGYDGTQQQYLTDNEDHPDEGYKTDVTLVKRVLE